VCGSRSVHREECMDIKTGLDADHAALETLKTALDAGFRSLREVQADEKKDRIADLKEIRNAVTKTDKHLLQVFSDLNSEREDRAQDVTTIRSMLKIFDKQVSMRFNEAEHILNTEATEWKDQEQRLEERFAELRGAVLIAMRGSFPDVEVAETGREFNNV